MLDLRADVRLPTGARRDGRKAARRNRVVRTEEQLRDERRDVEAPCAGGREVGAAPAGKIGDDRAGRAMGEGQGRARLGGSGLLTCSSYDGATFDGIASCERISW